MQTIVRDAASYQLPQIDLNFGIGDRVQLTYEIPYVLQDNSGQPQQRGWSNAYAGVKWRFLDKGDGGWQISVFPQVETEASRLAQQQGIAGPGPRLLLPLEATRKIGSFDVDIEGGYFVGGNGPKERIIGLVGGRSLTERLELDAEIYDDRPYGPLPHFTIVDVGGRYKLAPGIIALFMAGRAVSAVSDQQPEFIGYLGIQLLLSDYGRRLNSGAQ